MGDRRGSPPQVRGKLTLVVSGAAGTGITPAGAGKTATVSIPTKLSEDHPRRCGENSRNNQPFGRETGSPPQVRGKHIAFFIKSGILWITPAGAGKTYVTIIDDYFTQDHPRRCGENSMGSKTFRAYIGSPPQVRGKHRAWCLSISACRITPAGAGKTIMCRTCTATTRDHPRRCGENTKKIL